MIGYLIVGGVGFLFLVVSFLLGEASDVVHGLFEHDFHVDIGGHDVVDVTHDGEAHVGPSFFNMRVLAAFITGFGMVGALCMNYGWEPLPASLPGIGVGVVMAGAMYGFSALLYRQQGSSGYRPQELVGGVAEITVPIPENGVGQIATSVRDSSSYFTARSEDGGSIPTGQRVEIVGFAGITAIVKQKQ